MSTIDLVLLAISSTDLVLTAVLVFLHLRFLRVSSADAKFTADLNRKLADLRNRKARR